MTISVANVEYPDYWQKQVANFQSFEVPPHTAEVNLTLRLFEGKETYRSKTFFCLV